MEYRKLPRGTEEISILGLGNSSMGQSGEKEVQASVEMALENGINYFDMAAADDVPFAPFGEQWRDAATRYISRCISGRSTGPELTDGRWILTRSKNLWTGSLR